LSTTETETPRDPPSRADALRLYREMLRIRRFEERLFELLTQGKVGGTTHLCIGQEAVPVGVCSELRPTDQIVSTHRGHGHLLAKGARADRALAEIAGKQTGYCRGKGGSQHVAVPEIGHMGSNGITGGGLPIAIGLALAHKLRATGKIVVSYLGDGAADTGNFHESMNLAALWQLPVVFVLENNLYSMSTPVERTSACTSFTDWAARYRGMRTASTDGNDVIAVAGAFSPLAARARNGEGPALLECATYRQAGHSKSDARVYRTRDEEARWRERDPLEVLVERAGLTEAELEKPTEEVEAEIAAAVEHVLVTDPAPADVAEADLALSAVPAEAAATCEVEPGTELTVTEALRSVLAEEMTRDPRVVLIGEDIGVYGGAFGVTRGLLERFGDQRLLETPISESSFVGMGVGAAMGGLVPVVELMFGDFVACCMDSLVNHAAKVRYMYAGQVEVPFTLRMPVGRRRGYGATHSQSLEAWFVHVPGLVVAFPATLSDAVGLLRTSIRSRVPVLFLEHKLLYPVRGEMPASDHLVPFGKARIDREGDDLTLVTYGHALGYVREAADVLAARGYSVEILDLRSLSPYDKDACIASVRKTGRMLFVQEATTVAGVCDRVISDIGGAVFGDLRAPLTKVGGKHTPMPSSPALEDAVMPNARDVVRAALPLLTEY